MTLPAPSPAVPDRFVQQMRALCLATLLALVAHGLLWELVVAPTGSGTLAVKVLPLAAAALGLWRHRLYTYRWLSLLVWIYFGEGLVRATTERGVSQAMAIAEIALCTLLFAASVVYIRRRLGAPRSAA